MFGSGATLLRSLLLVCFLAGACTAPAVTLHAELEHRDPGPAEDRHESSSSDHDHLLPDYDATHGERSIECPTADPPWIASQVLLLPPHQLEPSCVLSTPPIPAPAAPRTSPVLLI